MGRLIAISLAVACLGGLAVAWLLYPAPVVPGSSEVPQLRGVPTSQAVANLAAVGLRGRITEEIADPMVPRGSVSWQSPAVYTVLPESSVVRLGISSGTPSVLVPDLIDLDLETASSVLDAAGLSIGEIDSTWSRTPAGLVTMTKPDARSGRLAGSAVAITLSKGPRGGDR